MKKEYCSGCYNDEYNHGLGGAKECWMLKTAKRENFIWVHINQMPPFKKHHVKKLPTCYTRPQYAKVSMKELTK